MKKTLFALLACATLAAPAMAKEWVLQQAIFNPYSGETNTDLYKFYVIYQDTTDIESVTTTIQANTVADFKTTYGSGYSVSEYFPESDEFEVFSPGQAMNISVTLPTNDYKTIWGIIVYENGGDVQFAVRNAANYFSNYVAFPSMSTAYTSFTPDSPTTPEPATATLSLLALAGLASRRRRH